jgi:hypothetical protein
MANVAEIDDIRITGSQNDINEVYRYLTEIQDDGFSYQGDPLWNIDNNEIIGSACGRWNDADFVFTFSKLMKIYPSLTMVWQASDNSMGWKSTSRMNKDKYYCTNTDDDKTFLTTVVMNTSEITRDNIYEMHNEDGPVITYFDGSNKEWYWHNKKIDCNTQEEFEKMLKMKAFW